jgi:hypothetical protein
MSYLMRIFWLITLLFFVSGCSGYKVACNFQSEASKGTNQTIGKFCNLESGEKVRINLVEGDQVEGTIQIIFRDEIFLETKGDSFRPRGYTTDQIQSIEKQSTKSKKVVGTILGVVGLVVLGIIILATGAEVDLEESSVTF